MSSENSSNPAKKPRTNPNLKSSIVHKPFATGTINIFNPYRNKNKADNKLDVPKLFLNAELEKTSDKLTTELESDRENSEIEYRERNWLDSLLSPWGITAIAVLFSINLISAGVIWRNTRTADNLKQTESPVSTVGNTNLTAKEFMPLNLSTLGAIEIIEAEVEDSTPDLTPISPALAPLNNLASLSIFNTEYHYVLTEYTGEDSLALARQKVKQVSLVNFPQGVFVYLGAFKQREDAESFVSQLKQENFSAYVYPLD